MPVYESLFMNKLKRSTPSDGSRRKQEMVASTAVDLGPTASLQSRTMMYARETAQPSNTRLVLTSERPLPRPPTSGKPMTASEQYWAARALTAEALLSMKSIHYEQIQMLSATEETKRAQIITTLHDMYEARQAKLEKAVIVLSAFLLAVFTGTVIYVFSVGHQAAASSAKARPLHFTIPILSPFASVVEHETSVIGTRTVIVIVAVAACLVYACVRHWIPLRLRA